MTQDIAGHQEWVPSARTLTLEVVDALQARAS
ncbi:hypothetical protein HNR40_004468 [Nonomuraea endophytica]|uniref:Uncharacterized protein n=1 Tax=Nonomuraea endophytica TaxID=714136 RepID=A0A7W8A3M0_9ACTN|nr:hypothetical protein [Nonomuraea endophytica]